MSVTSPSWGERLHCRGRDRSRNTQKQGMSSPLWHFGVMAALNSSPGYLGKFLPVLSRTDEVFTACWAVRWPFAATVSPPQQLVGNCFSSPALVLHPLPSGSNGSLTSSRRSMLTPAPGRYTSACYIQKARQSLWGFSHFTMTSLPHCLPSPVDHNFRRQLTLHYIPGRGEGLN